MNFHQKYIGISFFEQFLNQICIFHLKKSLIEILNTLITKMSSILLLEFIFDIPDRI